MMNEKSKRLSDEEIDLDVNLIEKSFMLASEQPEVRDMMNQMFNSGRDLAFSIGYTIFEAADKLGDEFARNGIKLNAESFYAPGGGFDRMYEIVRAQAMDILGADIDEIDPTLRQRTMNTIMELSKALDKALENGRKNGGGLLDSFSQGMNTVPQEEQDLQSQMPVRSLVDFIQSMGGL
ncbi:MAG: hypothetical protein QW328_08475 [Nitrososphaerota archaeon]